MTKKAISLFSLFSLIFFISHNLAQEDVQPSCNMCSAELVSVEEIQNYIDLGRASSAVGDMQIRAIDVGRSNATVAVVHRNALQSPTGRVAEHSLVTEIYYVLSGGGTVLTGPELVGSVPRGANSYSVTNLNGPGHNATDVRNGVETELNAGDVLFIPAGTGHAWIEIPDHATYLTFRIDPDKVVKLMDAEDSQRFLDSGGDNSVLR
ncbi:MAG: hypothetical protein MI746_11935 [Pseudomonadales bacterium]|nr:hypothetical protein [Pseudomonadales bacterium]